MTPRGVVLNHNVAHADQAFTQFDPARVLEIQGDAVFVAIDAIVI